MFNSVLRILLKIFELIGCISCLIIKNLTDSEARRIAIRNQKYSREWSLLTNVTWSREGNAFASVTYGGFTLITSLLLISRCINGRAKPTLTEKIFLTVGMIFFFTIGSLVYASLEQVPHDLHDNAIILGTLSYLVAILYLIDLADPMKRNTSNFTQTELENFNTTTAQTQTTIITSITDQHTNQKYLQNNTNNLKNDINESKNYRNQQIDITPIPSPTNNSIPPANGYYFAGDQVDIVQTKILPSSQQPIFSRILLPEKQRPFKEKIIQPKRLQEHQIHNYFEDEPFYRSDARSHQLNDYHRSSNGEKKKYQNKFEEYLTDDENIDQPIKLGFVAQAAKMWDRKAKRGGAARRSDRELSTIV